MTAVVPLPGIPRVNKGTKEPEHAALLAVSGAANPWTLPLPNLSFSILGVAGSMLRGMEKDEKKCNCLSS